jgi:hypothetical protein
LDRVLPSFEEGKGLAYWFPAVFLSCDFVIGFSGDGFDVHPDPVEVGKTGFQSVGVRACGVESSFES